MLRAILAAVLLFVAPLAYANPLRMHGLPVSNIPDLIVQMFPTQTKILDLTSVTTHCNTAELMSVTPVGTGASFEVDRGQILIASTTETWRKSELVNNTGYSADSDNQALNLIHTTSAAVGTGAATLNILCTSSGLTKVVRVDVIAGPPLDWNYGVETTLRYGGLNMLTYGSPTSRYTVDTGTNSCGTGVACSSIFEIWENHLMIKCIGNTTQCPVSGSGTGIYSATGATAAFTPTAGTSQDVLIDDSSGSPFTVHMHYIAHQRDVAILPTSGGSWTTANFGANQACAITQTAMHYGDTVLFEGTRALRASYGPFVGPNACVLGAPRIGARTQYTTPTLGPIPDFKVLGQTCSVAGDLCYSRPYSASLITWDCREVWECDFGMLWNVEVASGSKPTNLRFTHFNTANVSGHQGIYINAANSSSAINFQDDHLKADTITTASGASKGSYAYFLDNWVQDGSTGGSFAYCNSIIAGNRVLRVNQSDAFHLGIQACNDSSEGDTYPSFSWNWLNGLWLNVVNTHLDYAQGDWGVNAGGLKHPLGNNYVYKVVGNLLMDPPFYVYSCVDYYNTPTSGPSNVGVFYPNCNTTGNPIGAASRLTTPTQADGSFRSEGGQPFLMHDGSINGATIQYTIYGNYGAAVFSSGIATVTPGPASVVSYNAFAYSNELASTSANNLLPPGGYAPPTISNSQPGALLTADGNIVAANTLSWVGTGTFLPPGIDTPLVTNIDQTSGCSTALSCFSNMKYAGFADTANFANRMQPNLDAWVLTGAAVGHGPSQVVDIRGRKVTNPTAVAAHSGISLALPYCTVNPTISNSVGANSAAGFTGSIAGSVLTVTALNPNGSSPIVPGANTQLNGVGISAGVLISSQASGTTGGLGTYNLSSSPGTIASEGMATNDTRIVVGTTFSITPAVTWTHTTGTIQSGWQFLYPVGGSFAGPIHGLMTGAQSTYTMVSGDFGITHDPGSNVVISYLEYTGIVTNVGSNLCQSTSFAIY